MKRLILIILSFNICVTVFSAGYTRANVDAVIDSIPTNPTYVQHWANNALKQNKKCVDAYVVKAVFAIHNYEYKVALKHAESALRYANKKSNFTKGEIYVFKGIALQLAEDYEGAINSYTEAIKLDKNDSLAYLRRANLYFYLEQYDKAESDYHQLTILTDNTSYALLEVECMMKSNKQSEALTLLDELIRYRPKTYEAYRIRSLLKLEKKLSRQAIDDYIFYMASLYDCDYDEFVNVAKTDLPYSVTKITEFINAKLSLQKWYIARIHLFYEMEQFDDALRDIGTIESLYGETLFTDYTRSLCLNRLAMFREQARLLTHMADTFNIPIETILPIRAQAYRNAGMIHEAIKDIDSLIVIQPAMAEAYQQRAWIKAYLKDTLSASQDLDKAIAYDSTYSFAYLERGKLKLLQNDTIAAYNDFNRICSIDSTSDVAAFAYIFLGKSDVGISILQSQVHDAYNPSIQTYNLACAYAIMGRKADALRELKKSIDLGYKNIFAIENDSDIKSLKSEQEYIKLIKKLKESKMTQIFDKLKLM